MGPDISMWYPTVNAKLFVSSSATPDLVVRHSGMVTTDFVPPVSSYIDSYGTLFSTY